MAVSMHYMNDGNTENIDESMDSLILDLKKQKFLVFDSGDGITFNVYERHIKVATLITLVEPILERIKNANTMPKLDALRIAIIKDHENFQVNQKAFIAQKAKLKRIPRKDRNW